MSWFREECVDYVGRRMYLKCLPQEGDFGFHRFYNINYGSMLLPPSPFPYWIVGNLNYPGNEQLPNVLRNYYNKSNKRTNMHRIIVCVDTADLFIHSVYVTEHSDRTNFSPDRTFHVPRHFLLPSPGVTETPGINEINLQKIAD
ncbi:uncharacterized protein LOC107560599 [Tachysurus ichikawai]